MANNVYGLPKHVRKTNPHKIITKNLSPEFLSETLQRPWMRMYIFLDRGPLTRTPEHYKKFYYEWKVVPPKNPAHYRKKTSNFSYNDRGEVIQAEETFIPLKEPFELHQGLWGGEAVVRGFQRRGKKIQNFRNVPHFWMPRLQDSVIYSEILDRYMKTVVTERALNLIDQHYGLDNYILESTPADLMSELGLKLRREMYFKLLDKSSYPEDPAKNEEIYEKYKHHIVPFEVADWYGLNLSEANRKQIIIERENQRLGPYKNIFRKEYIEYLKTQKERNEGEEIKEERMGKLQQLLAKIRLKESKADTKTE